MNKIKNPADDYKSLLSKIPFGEENAISRLDLSEAMGKPDRQVRDEIALARRYYVILNASKGGYYRPTDAEMIKVVNWLEQETKRAKSILWSTRGAKKAVQGYDTKR